MFFFVLMDKSMDIHMESLSLSVDEDDELQIESMDVESPDEFSEFRLIGRFLTDKTMNFNAMRHRMAGLWCPGW